MVCSCVGSLRSGRFFARSSPSGLPREPPKQAGDFLHKAAPTESFVVRKVASPTSLKVGPSGISENLNTLLEDVPGLIFGSHRILGRKPGHLGDEGVHLLLSRAGITLALLKDRLQCGPGQGHALILGQAVQ